MTCKHRRYSLDTVDGKGYCIDCGADGWLQFVATKDSMSEHIITDPSEIRSVFEIDEAAWPEPESGFVKLKA